MVSGFNKAKVEGNFFFLADIFEMNITEKLNIYKTKYKQKPSGIRRTLSIQRWTDGFQT